uniref:Uncharacterized protein n=1 Tax=Gibberella zeae TaxID=5518 RepID=A0A4E9D1M4_GIBZA
MLSYNNKTPDLLEAYCFSFKTSVYNTLKAALVIFSIIYFLENTKLGVFFSLTINITSCTINNNQLALYILDLAYLLRLAFILMPKLSSPLTLKQSAY